MAQILYSMVGSCLRTLPVDAAGRRAFDETLADWRREAAIARSPISSAGVSVKALFATLRCVAGVSVREAAHLHQSGVLVRAALWTIALVTLTATTGALWSSVSLSGWSHAYLTVQKVAYFMPIALLLAVAIGRRSPQTSGLGLGLAAALVGFVLLGWGVPAASRAFLIENPARFTNPQTQAEREWRRRYQEGEGLTTSMSPGVNVALPSNPLMNDLNLRELAVKIVDGPNGHGWAALRWLSFFAAYLGVCIIAPVLASVLRRRKHVIRCSILSATVLVILFQWRTELLVSEFSVVWWFGAYWIPVVWIFLCLVAVASSASRGNVAATPERCPSA